MLNYSYRDAALAVISGNLLEAFAATGAELQAIREQIQR